MAAQGIVLSPAQRARIRRLSKPPERDASEAGGELNIVPFLDIVVNVLMFVLATIPVVFTSTIDLSLRHPGRPLHGMAPSLNLSMILATGGVSLKTGAFSIGPGCEVGGPGFTVAAAPDGSIPWGDVKACAVKLKNASPDYQDERDITLLAEPGTPHRTLVTAMDAVRFDGDRVLFDEVLFGVPR